VTDPLGDVLSFIEQYEQLYGNSHPDFYRGTYSQVNNSPTYSDYLCLFCCLLIGCVLLFIVSMRQHICYSALYAIARSFVSPSHGVDQSKTVEVRIMQPLPLVAP